jgi:shikimate kinase
MMGSGKSTVAAILGRLTRLPVISTDAMVEYAAQKSIARIFAEDGEPTFRALERKAVCSLRGAQVVDLGGGAFCDAACAAHLLGTCGVIFLDVTADEARRRIGGGAGRPLAPHWETLLLHRLPLYRRAHLTVPVDALTPAAVALRALAGLKLMGIW